MRVWHGRFVTAAIVSALIVSAGPRAFAAPDTSRTVTDEVGRKVTVPAEVKRIVTLAPNLTETIYALGLGDRLVGDTNFCDTPEAAKSKPHVGNPQNPNLEAIVALHPDLVLATTSINTLETADALKRLGIAVYTSDPQTVRGMLDSTSHVAEVIGAAQQGTELVGRMQQRLDALHARLSERPMVHVLFVVWLEPLQTIGQNTFIADALRWAGTESVLVSKQNWPHLSLEEVVRLQPDYIVFTEDHGGGVSTELADLRARPVWRDLDAVERGHVVNVSEEVVRPSPGLVDVIEQLARDVHPEAFAADEGRRSRGGTLYAQHEIDSVGAGLKPAPTCPAKELATCAR
ncbi:MAG: ABC transporter substrate-binding protein [Candidatus Acidoferrales bacterium]|nr:ABC transporter substrate-binding protein [Candidatus Acidoferrales bacterium]